MGPERDVRLQKPGASPKQLLQTGSYSRPSPPHLLEIYFSDQPIVQQVHEKTYKSSIINPRIV